MRWLLTYADMITLLLALFIILFAMSTMSKVKMQRLVHDLSAGFNSIDAINNPPEGEILGPNGKGNESDLRREQAMLQSYIKQKKLQNQVTVRMSNQGLVISLLSDKSFYNSGSAELRPATAALLQQVGVILKKTRPEIRVEGYTDNVPIHTAEYPTNWELSAARAAGVTRYLVERENIDPARVSLAGYGEWRPRAVNSTEAGRQENRRVDIVILNTNAPPIQKGVGRLTTTPAKKAVPPAKRAE
ncbi:MAG: flagellar motor protein MotB [Candidatus Eremiobacteraeota bacterium]|nr:flagellar motor protein MotB [Candidatus Eremiobacteraeota bacterium]